MNPTTKYLALTVVAILTVASWPAQAGGPLALRDTDDPYLWPDGGANIPFNPDRGGLGPLNNTEAVAQTTDAFQMWGDVASATATYVNAGPLPFDVDETNFFPFLFASEPDGLSAIVYDEDGAIFDLLFGPGTGVLGFAGPEWVDTTTGEILEGLSFLNGGSILGGFPISGFFDVQVHEFGHYTNLAHTVVNGQLFLGDTTGPTPFDTFPLAPPFNELLETMYPFAIPGFGQSTPHADDIAILSTLYPTTEFAATTGSIGGTILASNEVTRLTGVNVIARNVADPFNDAVSAISSDFTDDFSQSNPASGTYTLRGLTPGAEYAIFVDEILAGGFSTPPIFPFPGREEFFNADNESNNVEAIDDPAEFVSVSAAAGATVTGIDIVFNVFRPGEPLPVGVDGFVSLSLPFSYEICGQRFDSVFVNANGNLTFGAGSSDFTPSVTELLAGPPRIAAVWDDLNNLAGGVVTFDQTPNTFNVYWKDVPEFPETGANTFSITLHRSSNHADVVYGDLTAEDGLAGVSCGGASAAGDEPEVDLSSFEPRRINLHTVPAVYELFNESSNDLANSWVSYNGTTDYRDTWAEPNDTADKARRLALPFATREFVRFTEIEPGGSDVDYYRFRGRAGDTLIVRIASGQLDTVMGLCRFGGNDGADEALDVARRPSCEFIAVDDDSGPGLLSQIILELPADGDYGVAVSTFPDFDFAGDGFPSEAGRYVLEAFNFDAPAVEGSVFAVDPFSSSIFEFDLPTGAPLNNIPTPEPTSGGPEGLTHAGSSLFFVNGFGTNLIWELDPGSGAVLDAFPAPVFVNGSDGLAFTGGFLYSLDFSADVIFKSDPATGALISACSTGAGAGGGLAGGDGRLFAVLGFSFIAEIDPDTCAIIGTPIPAPGTTLGLAFNGSLLISADADSGNVFSIDPVTGIPFRFFFSGFPPTGLASPAP